ncbi:hypothetical protein ACFVZC_17085 [Streptomyces marokkonensis]|uniref:Secreted protein n=1 Tax=Streptomyces marokkonensis TaxID=324855 RepID=A0ABW6Q7C1_9ACTN
MSSSISALVIAFAGIAGTLTSGLLTQRSANNNKLRELERADQQRREDRTYQAEQAAVEARRTCYVSLNIAARLYQTALTNYLVAIRAGAVTDEIRTDVDEMRREHRARHAEAQMVVPDSVLETAGAVNSNLGKFYGILKSIDLGTASPSEAVEAAEARRVKSWDLLGEMRAVMRQDLGIVP